MTATATSRSGPPVVVVDDHDLVSEALVIALQRRDLRARRLAVRSEDQILRGLRDRPAGTVLLDLDLGRTEDGSTVDGLNLIERLRQAGWRVVVVTASRDRSRIAAAVAAGALGVVPKSRPLEELVHATVEAVEGRQMMTATERRHWEELHRRGQASRAHRDEQLGRLSPREREVLEMLARGMRVSGIAERAVVSEATVRTQVKSIRRKLEVTSQLEAVALLRAAGRGGAGP